jgi:hypothetical protein
VLVLPAFVLLTLPLPLKKMARTIAVKPVPMVTRRDLAAVIKVAVATTKTTNGPMQRRRDRLKEG